MCPVVDDTEIVRNELQQRLASVAAADLSSLRLCGIEDCVSSIFIALACITRAKHCICRR